MLASSPFRDAVGGSEGEGDFRRVSNLRGVERQLRVVER